MGKWGEFYKKVDRYDIDFFRRYINGCEKFIYKIIQYSRGKKCLEIGTGTGLISIYVASLGYEVTSIDNDQEILEEAKKVSEYFRATNRNSHFKGKLEFLYMDMFDLKFKENEFNIVFHNGVFEHYTESQIVQLLKTQLKVGECVVFSVPSNKYPQGNYGKEIFGDENFWGFKKYRKIMHEFKIIDEFGFEYLNRANEYQILKYATLPFKIFSKRLREHIIDSILATQIGFVIAPK